MGGTQKLTEGWGAFGGGFAVTASLVTPRAGHNDKTKKLRPQMEMGGWGIIVCFRFAEKYTEGKEGELGGRGVSDRRSE